MPFPGATRLSAANGLAVSHLDVASHNALLRERATRQRVESAPTGVRTQTEQFLKLLPLPIGLEGPKENGAHRLTIRVPGSSPRFQPQGTGAGVAVDASPRAERL